jgi:hypothetical protein
MADSDIAVISMSSSKKDLGSEQLEWGPLVLTNEKIVKLWNDLQEFPQLFDDYNKGNADAFIGKLLSPENIFIDIGHGLGLAAGFGVRPKLDMILHLVMFDKRLKGREGLFRDIMGYYFRALKLQRMTAIIADDCKTAIKLVQRLGFTQEGKMAKSVMRNGVAIDSYIYGILREEFDAQVNTQSARPTADEPTHADAPGVPLEPAAIEPTEL